MGSAQPTQPKASGGETLLCSGVWETSKTRGSTRLQGKRLQSSLNALPKFVSPLSLLSELAPSENSTPHSQTGPKDQLSTWPFQRPQPNLKGEKATCGVSTHF